MKMLNLLFRFILVLIHFYYDCIDFFILVLNKYRTLKNFFLSSKTDFKSPKSISDTYFSVVGQSVDYHEIYHLAFIFVDNEELPPVQDIAKVIWWCQDIKIKRVSFYDQQGRLSDCKEHLINYMSRRGSKNVLWTEECGVENSDGEESQKPNSYLPVRQTAKTSKPKISVFFLAESDTIDSFYGTTQRLASIEKNGFHSVSSDAFKAFLHSKKFNSPQLAIWCGKAPCNVGWCPYYLDCTEFMQLRNLQDLDEKSFFKLFHRYIRIEKRNGN